MHNCPYFAEETEVPVFTRGIVLVGTDPGLQAPSPECCLWSKLHAIIHRKILIQNFNDLFGVEVFIHKLKLLGAEPPSTVRASGGKVSTHRAPGRGESWAAPRTHALSHLRPLPTPSG